MSEIHEEYYGITSKLMIIVRFTFILVMQKPQLPYTVFLIPVFLCRNIGFIQSHNFFNYFLQEFTGIKNRELDKYVKLLML